MIITPITTTKIAFIGFGNIARAMVKGLANNKQYKITASAPSLTNEGNIDDIVTYNINQHAAQYADIIILAIKPKHMAIVLQELYPILLARHPILISLATGLSLKWIEDNCPPKQTIIRAMPNMPVSVNKGATPLIANKYLLSKQKDEITNLFHYLGILRWLTNENEMDIYTAFSGSGPAYVFLFIEALTNAAIFLGLTEEIALPFSLQILAGAVTLVQDTKNLPQNLRKQVTSEKGTTAAAIDVLEQHNFIPTIVEAITLAVKRAKEIGQEKF